MASFGAFTFGGDEEPVADTGWVPGKAITDISTNLGSGQDSIQTMGVGSSRRVTEHYLTPARLAVIAALVNTTASLTDWEAVPVVQSAFLNACDVTDAMAGYGTTSALRRVRLEFVAR